MELADRVERLERLYEKLYHESELLAIHIPKLTDILIRYWGASGRHTEAVLRDINSLRSVIKLVDGDLQEHFGAHPKMLKPTPKSKYIKYLT